MITETGQYMTFKLGSELFAIRVDQVREVLEISQITRVPTAPDYMRGVVNVRGQSTTVVDLRRKFGLPLAANRRYARAHSLISAYEGEAPCGIEGGFWQLSA